ncbi:MAG TPA: condensation domain-containing protein, partial [Ktedonosporobacter sp.]|nr:condensation domain-containing protein [Ktedonosporobacter sp.]
MKAFPGQSDELKRRELFELRLRQKGIALLKTPTLEARKEKADSYPLSFSQQRLWFLDQLEPGSSVYNVPVAVRLYGSLNVRNLELSIYEVVRRHESLRTTFSVKDGQPVQVIGSEAKLCLPLIDTSTLATEPCEAQVQRLALQEGRRAFNLSSGPLMRVLLLRLGPDEHVLLLTMHHIISDHWSRSILVREVTTLYNALETGRPSPLAPLPLQYADYALWQRRWLQGEVLAQQLDYW